MKRRNKQTENKKHENCVKFCFDFLAPKAFTSMSAKNAFTAYTEAEVAESFKYQEKPRREKNPTKVICHRTRALLWSCFLEMPKKSSKLNDQLLLRGVK